MSRTPQHRDHRIAALTVVATFIAFALGSGRAASEEAAKTNIIAYICDSQAVASRPWRNTLSRSIARALARTEGAHVSVRGEAQCGVANVEIACSAGVYDKAGPVMACSPETLVNLLKVSAWYAVEHATSLEEDYESFRLRHPARLGYSAFMAVNKDLAAPVAAQIETLRQEAEDISVSSSSRSQLIFEAIVNLVFAALIGHESSHLESQPPYCAIDSASRIEEAGLWKILLRITSSDELYKPETPDAGEVRADRCATRRIRQARTAIEKGELSIKDQDFVRRASADIVSTILLVRFGPGGASPYITPINESYLYTPLRIVALAGEFGLGQSGPSICGGAAENLTEATQYTYKQRPGNGALPDEIENLFPKGVIDAWDGKGWSPASFSCR